MDTRFRDARLGHLPGPGSTGYPPPMRTMLFHASAPSWVLVDEGFTLACEREIEPLFPITNGYIGTRASLEEGSGLSAPVTFVAGVFEQPATPGSVPQLTTFPNRTEIRVQVGKVLARSMNISKYLANRD